MDTITNLRTFLTVVRHAGFSEAARSLHVVPSVVAKRVAQLEQTMGARLFERSTRRVRLTEAGETLRARAAAVIDGFDGLVDILRRDERGIEGHIRVMAPTTLTTWMLGSVFADFLAQHSRITLEIALADRSTNPAEQAFDLLISGRAAVYEGVQQFALAPIGYRLCASPEYARRRPLPSHPAGLVEHACLVFKPGGSTWEFVAPRGTVRVEVTPRLLADDNRSLLWAAHRGLGIARLPEYVAREALARGSVIPVLESFPLQTAWFNAYVPHRLAGLARIKALRQFLTESFQQWAPPG